MKRNNSPSDWLLIYCITKPKVNASSIFTWLTFDGVRGQMHDSLTLTMRFHTTLGKPADQDWEKSVVHQN